MAEPKKTGSLAVGEPSSPPPLPSCDGLVSETGADFWNPPKFVANLIFTAWQGTQAALRAASQWPRRLEPRIVLWSFQIVSRYARGDL